MFWDEKNRRGYSGKSGLRIVVFEGRASKRGDGFYLCIGFSLTKREEIVVGSHDIRKTVNCFYAIRVEHRDSSSYVP